MLSSASPTKSEPVGLDLRPGRSLLATIPSAGAATRRPSSSPMSTTEPSVANSQGSAPGPIWWAARSRGVGVYPPSGARVEARRKSSSGRSTPSSARTLWW